MKRAALWLVLARLFLGPQSRGAEPSPPEAPAATLQRQQQIIATGPLRLQQRALRRLAEVPGAAVDDFLADQLTALQEGRLPLGLWLDLLEVIAQRPSPTLRARVAEREKQLAAEPDRLKAWRDCLEGGDADAGRTLFRERVEAGCLRCHRLGSEGGEIGPDLTSLHQRAERISILESILEPSSFIVPGFKQVAFQLRSGEEVAGIVNVEGTDLLHLTSPTDGHKFTISSQEIVSESALPSAMPPGFGAILGRRALRDLVEFLATGEKSGGGAESP